MIFRTFIQALRNFRLDTLWRKKSCSTKDAFFSPVTSSGKRWKDRHFSLFLRLIVFWAVLSGISFPALAAQRCPSGIHPAENEDALVENIFNFLLDIYNQKIVSFSEEIIHCYFPGDIKWKYINDDTWSVSEYDQEPEKWTSIIIKNLIKGKDYVLKYESENRNLLLEGKDRDFDPLPIFLKRFGYLMIENKYHRDIILMLYNSRGWRFSPTNLEAAGLEKIPIGEKNKFYGFHYQKNHGDGEEEYQKDNFFFYLETFIDVKCFRFRRNRDRYINHYIGC